LPEGHLTELPVTNHFEGPVAEDTVTTGNAVWEFVRSRDREDDLSGSGVQCPEGNRPTRSRPGL